MVTTRLAVLVLATLLTLILLPGCASDPQKIASGQATIVKAEIKKGDATAEREREQALFLAKLEEKKRLDAEKASIRAATQADRIKALKAWYSALELSSGFFVVGAGIFIGTITISVSAYILVVTYSASRYQLAKRKESLELPRLRILVDKFAPILDGMPEEKQGTMTLVDQHTIRREAGNLQEIKEDVDVRA
jgi:hypothetical protein